MESESQSPPTEPSDCPKLRKIRDDAQAIAEAAQEIMDDLGCDSV